jgi:Cys-tRNA(Pro) deacylase
MDRSDLSAFLAARGIAAGILEFKGSVHSVAEAADQAGMPHDAFIKTMVLIADGSPAIAIIPGDRRLDINKAAKLLGAETVRIAKPPEVLETIGYPVGGVPPVFDNAKRIPFLIDDKVLARNEIIGGGGDAQALLRISPAEIMKEMKAVAADLCSD